MYGSRIALEHLRDRGGSLINLGSTVSDRAIPLQGIYAASKHAAEGFTDALRMELESDNVPVSVTLIKPGPIDTPFPINARNYLDTEPQHVPPVYAPEEVARAPSCTLPRRPPARCTWAVVAEASPCWDSVPPGSPTG